MKTVVGVFPNAQEAQLTADELEDFGLDRGDITFVDRSSGVADDLVDQLTRYGVPYQTARLYVESINRGGTLESVRVEDDQVEETMVIMRRHAGEVGGSAAASSAATSGVENAKPAKRIDARDDAATARISSDEDETISVIGEELVVGKREIERGGVKVTSRVVEQPASENVQLREEKVTVDRQPANREIDPKDADFREQTIEMVEHAETPVVGKRARVIEEITLRKDVGQRTENVKGTVRKMNVDVENLASKNREFDGSQYRSHYEQLGATDGGYDQYEPAYKFGHQMREDSRFVGDDWEQVEPKARAAWEERNPNTWERFKAAVRHAWDRMKT
jgi:stress response protein YsnF